MPTHQCRSLTPLSAATANTTRHSGLVLSARTSIAEPVRCSPSRQPRFTSAGFDDSACHELGRVAKSGQAVANTVLVAAAKSRPAICLHRAPGAGCHRLPLVGDSTTEVHRTTQKCTSAQDWAKAQVRGGERKSADQSATLHFDSAGKRAAESGASLRTQKMAVKVAHGEVSNQHKRKPATLPASTKDPAADRASQVGLEGDADVFVRDIKDGGIPYANKEKSPALGLRAAGSNSPGWFSFCAGLEGL